MHVLYIHVLYIQYMYYTGLAVGHPLSDQQDGADGLGWVGHIDGSFVATHLREVGQGPAVVQVEVAGNRSHGNRRRHTIY